MIAIIFDYKLRESVVQPIPSILLKLTSIIFTRFILKLRDFGNGNAASEPSLRNSTVRFATRTVTGNMGAPLEYTSMDDGPSNRHDCVSFKQQIENPLSVGILDDHPNYSSRCAQSTLVVPKLTLPILVMYKGR
ncbi:hypothetical protein NLI96_g6600 [Meripilus lineatus]|uniref:Uncharacterized protein n=1 Tax=Meripilus lineatus TaxID=2056292 RepID=A0AAD5V2E9_9APHY|nr:hypothetical protein NLI96_g6600 [Physisporinus lineatus]